MNGRSVRPELLDALGPRQARANLVDLTRINRWFGGHRVLKKLLGRLVDRDDVFTVLDVGAASGDLARCIERRYPRSRTVCLDHIPFHLDGAPAGRIAADAFHLPVAPESFDFVLCSLFLHHFSEEQVVGLLRSFASVARRAVLVIDLERNPLPYHFLSLTRPVFRWNDVTIHDGKRSVEAGFRKSELMHLARTAGFPSVRARAHYPWFRLSVVLPSHGLARDRESRPAI